MDFDENSFKKGDDGGDMRRVNWGILGKVGLQLLDHYQFSVSYNQGLNKPGHSIMSNSQRMFNVSIGYIF